jgi:hypothetical protein
MFFWAVLTSASNVRLSLPGFLKGLRSASSSSANVRFHRVLYAVVAVVVVGILTFGVGTPKSRSGRESLSESELSTISWPLEVTRLLVPEFADVCEGLNGGASALAALIVEGAVDAREGFDEESGVLVLAACGAAAGKAPDELGVRDRGGGALCASGRELVSLRPQVW